MSARLGAPLCATLLVVHEALDHASRGVVRRARLDAIDDDEIPSAEVDGDLVALARLWREREILLAGEREESELRLTARNRARWFAESMRGAA